MSTSVGGQEKSALAVMPPRREALLTVGIAAGGNFLFLPSTSRPLAIGLLLTGWPAIVRASALRAASAQPVVDRISARSEMTSETAGRWPFRRPRIGPRGRGRDPR